jgi:hypothetical protein
MRHAEPEIVTQYRAAPKVEPPKVCHTCDHYTDVGLCTRFGEAPPVEFASEPGGCELWVEEVPF